MARALRAFHRRRKDIPCWHLLPLPHKTTAFSPQATWLSGAQLLPRLRLPPSGHLAAAIAIQGGTTFHRSLRATCCAGGRAAESRQERRGIPLLYLSPQHLTSGLKPPFFDGDSFHLANNSNDIVVRMAHGDELQLLLLNDATYCLRSSTAVRRNCCGNALS